MNTTDDIPVLKEVDDDHFTWWFDVTDLPNHIHEVASMAWFTVVSRFELPYVPDMIDKYAFNAWFGDKDFIGCSKYEIANMAWNEAKEQTLRYLNQPKKNPQFSPWKK
jgi:hypothetical protein